MTIKQRFEKDCFLTCIAMAAGIEYDLALYLFGDELVEKVKAKGTYGNLVTEAFLRIGLVPDADYTVVNHCIVAEGNLFRLPPHSFRDLLWGRRACIQVKSKNYEGEYHIVFWDGRVLHDPSPLKTYEWDEVEPIYAWIFDERKDGREPQA